MRNASTVLLGIAMMGQLIALMSYPITEVLTEFDLAVDSQELT